jgi:DNA-binding winged helix-turn-helix (wHTH) protein/tetratricopeptide (TPR) repeat protein
MGLLARRDILAGMIHAFRGCELDEELFQLRRRGRVVKLEPKAFDLLAYLLRHRDRVVPKPELLRALWPDVAVTESVLPSCIGAVRRAVGDDRARARVIQTVHGRGYRFVAEVEERSAAGPGPGATPAASPFVGREHALDLLRAGLNAALAGRGRLLLLVGEPGIGKTRTAEEFASEARRRGTDVLTGRAHEGEGAPAFWPWVKLLRSFVASADPSTLAADMGPGAAEIAELVPELRERFGDLRTPPPLDEEQARFRLFDSLTTFLQRTSERRPLVLILDDLHWADDASLQLLRFLAGELGDSRLLVVGTYRDVEVQRGRPLADALGALAREPTCERIALRGLDSENVARFVEALVGEPPSPSLATTVHEMTEGNPFFIQEVVRLFASEGRLDALEEVGSRPLALPQSVRDAIGRRLDALSKECNQLLRVASVLGREFSTALLERVTAVPRGRLLDLVGEATAARVLTEVSEAVGAHAFQHALIHQTLYEELDTPERVRLHRQAGEALEDLCGAHPGPHLTELAHHFFQASADGDPGKAIEYGVLAAERAHRLLAYEEAARQYEHALQALELRVPRDETRRCELLLALGDARATAGQRRAEHAAFDAAAEIARRLDRRDLFARAALGRRGSELGAPVAEPVRALVDEALDAIGEEHPALRARILGRLAGTPPHSNSMETREALIREARALAHRSGDPAALRDVLQAARWACLGPDRIDDRRALAAELFELGERQGDATLTAVGHDVMLGAHLLRGEIEAADRALDAYARIAQETRQPVFLWETLVWRGSRAVARGAFREAETLIREAYERGRRSIAYSHYVFAGQMHYLHTSRGDGQHVEQSPVFFGEMMRASYAWAPAIRATLAREHAVRGETERARRTLDDLAQADFRDLPRDEHWLPTIGSFGSLACVLEDARRAALVYDLLAPYAGLFMIHDLLRANSGSVAALLGILATLLGCHEDAAGHFEDAISRETAMDASLAVLISKAAYARLLLQCGASGDRRRGLALVDEASSGWAALGIRGLPASVIPFDELTASRSRAEHFPKR